MRCRAKIIGCFVIGFCLMGCVQKQTPPVVESGLTHTPVPTATAVPSVTPTSAPLPTATCTPSPAPTSTPLPTATSAPSPMATGIPLPTATSTPSPIPTNTPMATVTPVPREQEMSQILSSAENYRVGWYKSWGGEYEETEGSLCLKEYLEVGEEPLYFSINDSRIVVSVHEYSADKTWLKYSGNLENGFEFVKQENTKFITVTIRSREWGVDLYSLFELGLELKFSKTAGSVAEETVALDLADFNDASLWIPGEYSGTTGGLALKKASYAFGKICEAPDDEYVIHFPNSKYQLKIVERSQDGNVVRTTVLENGQRWKKQETTFAVALSVLTKSKEDFAISDALKSNNGSVLLESYVPYQHDMMMQELTAQEFVADINVGWNLGNSLDSKSVNCGLDANLKQELNWGNPYVCKELIDYVAACGFNTIRIPVTWCYNAGTEESGKPVIGEQFLARVQEVVDYAIANDLYVILNAHHEQPMIYAGVSEDEIQVVYNNAKALWQQIAAYFITYDEHLIFEAYNEVDNLAQSWSYGDVAAAQMNELNQIFVDTVRATGGNNASRILIVPTLLDGTNAKIRNAFRLPADTAEDRLVVEMHTYSKKFTQTIETEFTELEQFSKEIGAPIILGEFGTTNSYEFLELRTIHAANFVARAANHGIKCIWWDNGSDYAIINRTDYDASDMAMIQALLDGVAGKMCVLEEGVRLNKAEQFLDGMLNQSDGKVAFSYWGTLATEEVRITEGTHCMVSLKATEEATDIWLQRIAFYDAEGNVLPFIIKDGVTHYVKELQNLYYVCEVPDNASFVRISVNSPYENISRSSYEQYLEDGVLELTINFFDMDDVSLQ